MPIEYIKDIIISKAHLQYDSTKKQITIKEIDPSSESKLKQVYITHIAGKCFGFRMDYKLTKKCRLTHLLLDAKSKNNIHKGVDGIIFYKSNTGKKYILVCELKSGGKRYENQFKSSHAFVEYLSAITDKFANENLKQYVQINIIFTTKVSKQTLRPPKYFRTLSFIFITVDKPKYYIGIDKIVKRAGC